MAESTRETMGVMPPSTPEPGTRDQGRRSARRSVGRYGIQRAQPAACGPSRDPGQGRGGDRRTGLRPATSPARQLRSGSSSTIAYVVLDARNPFFTDVARGIEEVASVENLTLFLCNSDLDARREAQYLDQLLMQRVQGVLITAVDYANERLRLAAGEGRPGRVRRQHGGRERSRLVQRRRTRRRGRAPRRHPPDRAGAHADRVRRGTGEHPAGRRPAHRCAASDAGRRPGRRAPDRSPDRSRSPSRRVGASVSASSGSPPGVDRRRCSAPTTCSPSVCCST